MCVQPHGDRPTLVTHSKIVITPTGAYQHARVSGILFGQVNVDTRDISNRLSFGPRRCAVP